MNIGNFGWVVFMGVACLGCFRVRGQSVVLDSGFQAGGGLIQSGSVVVVPESAGVRFQNGGSVFHSFERFGVGTGETVIFSGAAADQVIARVRGGDVSEIFGSLVVNHAGADFYLMNPAGIVFGAGAQVDVRGVFYGTTASFIRLGEGVDSVVFDLGLEGSQLVSAPPEAFGFLDGGEKGEIRFEGVGQGRDFLKGSGDYVMVGRDLDLRGSELVSQGGVEFQAVGAGAVEVPVRLVDGVDGVDLMDLRGRLVVSEGSVVRAVERRVSLGGEALSVGGKLLVRAGEFEVSGGSVVETSASDVVGAGEVSVRVGELLIEGGGSGVKMNGPGVMEVEVSGGSRILNGGRVEATTSSELAAGRVDFRSGSLFVDGGESGEDVGFTGIVSFSRLVGLGAGDGSGGRGGDLSVQVGGDGSFLGNWGEGVRVAPAGTIVLRRGGLIDASSFGGGDAGGVSVRAEGILIDRGGSEFFTGVGTDTESYAGRVSGVTGKVGVAGGAAGNVEVRVNGGRLDLRNGGTISSSSEGSGDGGSVSVSAGRIEISGKGELTQQVPTVSSGIVALAEAGENSRGDGGSVTVRTESLYVMRDGQVSVQSSQGTAGRLRIELTGKLVNVGGEISAKAGRDGGSIEIEGGTLVYFSEGSLTAEATGAGGNVTIAGPRFLVLDETLVTANAEVGMGGVIDFGSAVFLAGDSLITATGGGGDGEVTIRAEIVLNDKNGEDDEEPLDATERLQAECTKQLPSDAGSFIRAGKGGTPRGAGGYLPSLRLLR